MSRPPKALVVLTRSLDEEPTPGGAALRQLECVANRPLLAHVLDRIASAGIEEAGLVVRHDTAEHVRAVVEDGHDFGLHATYIPHDDALGDGDAILAAEEFIDGARFLFHRGDCLIAEPLATIVQRAVRQDLDALVAVRGKPGGADRSRSERLAGPAALPLRMLTDASAVAAFVLGPAVVDALHRLRPSWRGQIELADAIDDVLAAEGAVELRTVAGCCFEGNVEELLACNRILLDRLLASFDPRSGRSDTRIDGRVLIHHSARVDGSVVRGPSIIGPGAHVVDSYIGPYSSIGAGALVEDAEVEDLIVGERAVVAKLGGRLTGSVIGPGARVSRDFGRPGGLRVCLGARAEIVLG